MPFFLIAGQREKITDFLQLIEDPVKNGIRFTSGFDGFPAFQLTEQTDIRSPARNVLPGIYKDFAVMVTTKPTNQDGGFLFAIMTPDDTVIQLGLSALMSSRDRTNITLYLSDYLKSDTSIPIARFDVPSFTNQWTRYALKVQDDFVTLFLDCMEYGKVEFERTHFGTLPFDPQSTIYVGQGGDIMGRKYLVSLK